MLNRINVWASRHPGRWALIAGAFFAIATYVSRIALDGSGAGAVAVALIAGAVFASVTWLVQRWRTASRR